MSGGVRFVYLTLSRDASLALRLCGLAVLPEVILHSSLSSVSHCVTHTQGQPRSLSQLYRHTHTHLQIRTCTLTNTHTGCTNTHAHPPNIQTHIQHCQSDNTH